MKSLKAFSQAIKACYGPGNINLKGRLSTVDHLIIVAFIFHELIMFRALKADDLN